jgi:glycerophosphoryl diester phosphodiesterase
MISLIGDGPPLVIAHRGNRAHAPENTMEAFGQAVRLGVDALELDLRVTEDAQLVVLHDATVDRTTNAHGPISRLTLREAQLLDAGYRFTSDGGRTYPFRDVGVRLPSFDEVLEAVPTLPLIIELKTAGSAELLWRTLVRHRALARVLVGSFHDAALAPLRGRGVALSASVAQTRTVLPAALLGRAVGQPGFDAFCIPPTYYGIPVPVGRLADVVRGSGAATHVWTVNAPSVAVRLWHRGIRGIISDDPGPIIAAREKMLGRV